ncbi:MAG: AI-2E family transporter [Aquisalimonadaceae bacterium]
MSPPEPLEHKPVFSVGDLRLFRFAAVLSAALLVTGLIVFIIWILAQLVGYFSNLIVPLAVAGVLALVLSPIVDFLERHPGVPRVFAVIALFVIAILALGAILVVVVPVAIEQGRDFIKAIPEMVRSWQARLEMLRPGLLSTLAERLEQINLESVMPGLEDAAGRIMSYVGLAVGMAFIPLYLFFALMSEDRLKDYVRELLSVLNNDTQQEVIYLGSEFVGYVTAFFRGQLLIAMIMAAMLAIGFTLIGLEAAIIFGILLGLLNIVPFLGTIVGLATVLPVAYFQPDGGLQLIAMALVVFGLVQLIESWILTPKIMADRSGLHPAVVVISIFFWGTVLGGIIGMILAVPLTAFVMTLWQHLKLRFTRALISERSMADAAHHDAGTGLPPGGRRPGDR